MIYEQSCIACNGDMVVVREMHGLVLWCIGCGLRTEPPEAINVISAFEAK